MRKIISGFWFRLVKGYEIWVMIALLLFAGIYIDHSFLCTYSFLNLVRVKDCVVTESSDFYDKTYDLSAHSIKDYRFETQGISALDLYKFGSEALPEEAAKKIISDNNCAYIELNVFSFMIVSSVAIPMVLMMIFIPVFFGRIFSDGTIKNYIAGGHSKGKVYLSSLVFTFCIDMFLVSVNLLIFGFWCVYYEWKPPFYLPVVLALLISSILLLFTITTLCLALLFLSTKQTVALIIGLLVSVYCLMGGTTFSIRYNIYDSQEANEADYQEYVDIYLKSSKAYFDQRLDLSEFAVRTYYAGRELKLFNDSNLAPFYKNSLLVSIYTNPLLIYELSEENLMSDVFFSSSYYDVTPYMMCRDGLIAINIASNIFWISLMSGVVILATRKKEVKG